MATFMGKSMMTPITPPNLMRPMFQTHQELSRMLQGARTIHTTRPEATLQRCRQHLNRGGTGRGANKVLDRKLVEPPNAGTNHEWFCTPNNKLPPSFSGNIGNGLYNPSPKGWFTIGFTTLGPLIFGRTIWSPHVDGRIRRWLCYLFVGGFHVDFESPGSGGWVISL